MNGENDSSAGHTVVNVKIQFYFALARESVGKWPSLIAVPGYIIISIKSPIGVLKGLLPGG